MLPIVVQKYGGSSVADCTRIKRVAERIAQTKRAGKEVCVVVSAMGSATDDLMSKAREISTSPKRRELDMLLTCGERAAMALLSMAVMEEGFEAISFTGSQCGIMTNDRHSGARIIEVRPVRVEDELARGKVVIVAGFQGVSYKREITTLGRGGSDTTAVALAAALGAEYCEICSDVDGVYSADPRLVNAAQLIESISHDEMLELAVHGAKVLHAESVEFARRSKIALYARATASDAGKNTGTRVDLPKDTWARIARAVTGKEGLVKIVVGEPSVAVHIFSLLADARVPIFQCVKGGEEVSIWLVLDDVPDWPTVREQIQAKLVEGDLLCEGQGAVSLIGFGMGSATVSRTLAIAADLNVHIAHYMCSSLRFSVFCDEANVPSLTQALHSEFCEVE